MSIVPYASSLQRLNNEWSSAPPEREKNGYNQTEKTNLYDLTDETLAKLNRLYKKNKNNPERLAIILNAIQEAFKKPTELQLNTLGKWIAENSCHGAGPGMDYVGAYRPLHHLFILETEVKKSASNAMDVIEIMDESEKTLPPIADTEKEFPEFYVYDESLTALANIDKCALNHIEKLKGKTPRLVDDILIRIFLLLDLKDLAAMAEAYKFSKIPEYKVCRKWIMEKLVALWNQGVVDVEELGLSDMTELINFFGDECKNIHEMALKCSPDTPLNEIAKRFSNLKRLTLSGNYPRIGELKNKFTSVTELDLFDIFDPEIFNQMLKNFPSIRKLCCAAKTPKIKFDFSINKVKDFSVLKDYISLKEIAIQGGFVGFEGLDGCASLEKVTFDSCAYLRDVQILKNLPKLSHLTLKNCDSLKNIDVPLPKLKYFYTDRPFFFNFRFLESSPKLETLVLKGISFDSNVLNYASSITTLKLINFSNLMIPEIKKCPSLKTLTLSFGRKTDSIDFRELNQCSSLKTLRLRHGHILSDIALFKDQHPTLSINLYKCILIPKELYTVFPT